MVLVLEYIFVKSSKVYTLQARKFSFLLVSTTTHRYNLSVNNKEEFIIMIPFSIYF